MNCNSTRNVFSETNYVHDTYATKCFEISIDTDCDDRGSISVVGEFQIDLDTVDGTPVVGTQLNLTEYGEEGRPASIEFDRSDAGKVWRAIECAVESILEKDGVINDWVDELETEIENEN